jgi:curved DNA-binding protein CbpA
LIALPVCLARETAQIKKPNPNTFATFPPYSKFPNYTDEATAAFQRVSLAYETLSKPVSRKAYDLSGAKNGFGGPDGDPLGPGKFSMTHTVNAQ